MSGLQISKPTCHNQWHEPVENETHFLFSCKAYNVERALWFSKMTLPNDFYTLPANSKLPGPEK
jgi:hypothetical protein